jgi:hypothetical protein
MIKTTLRFNQHDDSAMIVECLNWLKTSNIEHWVDKYASVWIHMITTDQIKSIIKLKYSGFVHSYAEITDV